MSLSITQGKRGKLCRRILAWLADAPDDEISALSDFIEEGEVTNLVVDTNVSTLSTGVAMLSKAPHKVMVDARCSARSRTR